MSDECPKLAAPPGACDTHMHIYDASVAAAPGGQPFPGDFTVPMAAMLDLLLDWVPDDASRRKILVDNPAELYGF
jgi:D-galactarolactone isomerase